MGEWAETESAEDCAVDGCDRDATVRLNVPWEGVRDVCAAHGRAWGQKEGVVAMPIETARDEWSQGRGETSGEDSDAGNGDGSGAA